jgi:voltage-dependent calcium channel
MRGFKKVWAQYANPRTGYLENENLVRFFGVRILDWLSLIANEQKLPQKLSGVFEVKIYPTEFSVSNIRTNFQMDEDGDLSDKRILHIGDDSIDIRKMNRILDKVDHAAIRQRRNRYLRIYHEAQISCPMGRGISFTEMLMLLAHHKLIVEHEALRSENLPNTSLYFFLTKYIQPQRTCGANRSQPAYN